MAGEIVVRIDRLFPGHPAIRADFEIDLTRKATTILFGPSGAGKTTVLRCLAGLERPDHGLIRFGDEIWFDSDRGIYLTPQARRIGFLAQDYALFPHLTVRENVEYGLAGSTRAERREAAARMLEFFEITHLAGRQPPEISGGEAQRVALARALAPSPRLLLLDEPCPHWTSPRGAGCGRNYAGICGRFKFPGCWSRTTAPRRSASAGKSW
jgi:molybdate transport system ATP-binding protein